MPENEEDIRAYFISQGEDPDAIIERALKFVKLKEDVIKLKPDDSERKN